MADFKTALEALAKGELKLESLSSQLDGLLKKAPQFANKMLMELDEFHQQKKLDDKAYAHLKRQINEFRRTHAKQTETSAPANADATVFAQDSVAESAPEDEGMERDVTRKMNTGDSTRVMSEDEKQENTNSADSEFIDLSTPSSNTSTNSVTSATGPAGTEWNEPEAPVGDLTGGYKEGSIIKQRFKLEKVLGVGGMGKVYMALDLLKAEAKDKKPHVAIKLLNDDFKDHPEAFISLQRESSRQQKLAHPNIATIYDFDRVGGPNTPVFITMELMEGMELKDYIKKKVRHEGGLPFDEAYDIIKQLGAGLIYAHERNLVHSDFKPGNAFLCNDGTVKTLDFGIARAVKNPVTGEAEKTLFDPGKLGALTPAYASLEMLDGQEPDTRDDIYALGCTAYELLTGKHPFNKLPANKAQENNLVPPYIKSLNKKQNRALRHSVAFKREDRSPNVADFLEELEGKATFYKNPFFIAASVLVLIGLMLINPALDYLKQQRLDAMVAEIQQGTEQVIVAKLDEIRLLEKADQNTVTSEARDAIQNYFSDKIAALIDTSGDSYDFPAANTVLNEIREFYPGSTYLADKIEQVAASKRTAIGDLYAEFKQALDDESLIGETNQILARIKAIDPSNPLLEDQRPGNAYRVFALNQLEQNNYEQALALVRSGMKTESGKDDPRLTDLENRIVRAQNIATYESELGVVQEQLATLTDFKQEEETIVELAKLKPNSEMLASVSAKFKPLIDNELAAILKEGNRSDAEILANDFNALMNGLQLNKELTQVQLAHLSGDERKAKITELASNNITNIQTALAQPEVDNAVWETSLLRDVQELSSLVNEDEGVKPELNQFRTDIADLYVAKANETLQAERYDAADAYLDTGERYAPGNQTLLDTRQEVIAAREETERLARVEGNKGDFKAFTEANNIAEAEKVFTQLKQDLPENDNYILFEAPPMLADAYARLAQSKAETKDFATAFAFVQKGLEVDPNNGTLADLKNSYQAEANISELTQSFQNDLSFPNTEVRLKLSQIELGDPARYAQFSKQAAKILADRITALRTTDENAAAALAQSAASFFPADAALADLRTQLQLKPWPQLAAANSAIAAGKLSQATQIQQQSATEFAAHPDFLAFSQTLENKIKEANSVFDIYIQDKEAAAGDEDKLRVSSNLLTRALGLWTDNPDYLNEQRELNSIINKPRIRQREGDIGDLAAAATGDTAAAAAAAIEQWSPISSDSECTSRLAGYGTRARAICYDMIHQQARGPLMVVVPGGSGIEKPFAIAKYEISVSDYSKYCILSGTCPAIKDKDRRNDPMTGISLQEAEAYANWLSERTGKTYRIPTKQEWEYAANAGGKQPDKDFNCSVSVNQKLIKGTGTVSVKSGKSNGWGLKNYVGNVQEWVLDGNTTFARGGAYTDPHAKCEITLERTHDGSADETTGFRLVRDDVG